MVSTLPFMDFYDILCARILLNYRAMPRTVEILTGAAALGKASLYGFTVTLGCHDDYKCPLQASTIFP